MSEYPRKFVNFKVLIKRGQEWAKKSLNNSREGRNVCTFSSISVYVVCTMHINFSLNLILFQNTARINQFSSFDKQISRNKTSQYTYTHTHTQGLF